MSVLHEHVELATGRFHTLLNCVAIHGVEIEHEHTAHIASFAHSFEFEASTLSQMRLQDLLREPHASCLGTYGVLGGRVLQALEAGSQSAGFLTLSIRAAPLVFLHAF